MSAEKSWAHSLDPERGSGPFAYIIICKKVIKNVLDKFPEVWDN